MNKKQAYYRAHAEERREYQRRYRREHREECREYFRKYREEKKAKLLKEYGY